MNDIRYTFIMFFVSLSLFLNSVTDKVINIEYLN